MMLSRTEQNSAEQNRTEQCTSLKSIDQYQCRLGERRESTCVCGVYVYV